MERLTLHCLIYSLFTFGQSQLYNGRQLPLSIVPYHYDVTILTHLEKPDDMRFEGHVRISLRILEPTNLIVLHVNNLTVPIDQIELCELITKKRINIIETEINKSLEYLILQVENQLEMEKTYSLKVLFGRSFIPGDINSYFVGSRINIDTNKTSWYAVTNFEKNYIRSVLPSFDEPSLRATFNVTLGHHKRFQSFSNMPRLRKVENADLKNYVWRVYEVTPPMPTYLLAFSVNEFNCASSKTTKGKVVDFRTCAMGSPLNSTFYLSNLSPKLLEYFGELFDLPYPLEKIDQLVMRDETGGMENWGLILYGYITLSTRKEIVYEYFKDTAHLVAHELAHMWFGNLVTVKSWSDFWIKEGFASYFSFLAIAHMYPHWNHYNRQFCIFREMAFYFDGQTTFSLSNEANQQNKLAYHKSISIIGMMHGMLGDKAFYRGLRTYLRQYAYGSASQDDLWIQLQRANEILVTLPNGFQVKTIMDTWTRQHGYPIVTINRNLDGKSFTVNQKHFFVNSTHKETWWIPLSYTTEWEKNFNNTFPRHWLKGESSATIRLYELKEKWVIFNIQSTGYYRINYDNTSWLLLAKALIKDHKIFHELNRVQLVSDALFLYRQNQLEQKILYNLLEYLVIERSYTVWMPYTVALETQTIQEKFHQKLIESVYYKYGGLQDDLNQLTDWDETNIVSFVMKYACAMKIGDCVENAFGYLKNQTTTNQTEISIGEILKPAINCAVKCHGNHKKNSTNLLKNLNLGQAKYCPCLRSK